MKRVTALLVAAMLSAAPVAAEWRADASTLTWFHAKPTADMQQLRDALLWYYEGQALNGLLATSARPNIALTDVGGGNSELAITLPLAAGNTWVAALVLSPCPSANTTALRRACADPLIKSDLRRVWREYRAFLREQSTPIVEPPAL
jgi:hypothetical protein